MAVRLHPAAAYPVAPQDRYPAELTRIGGRYFVPVEHMDKIVASAVAQHAQDEISAADLPKVLLRLDEAAELLGVSKSSVYKLIAARELPAIKIGGSRRVPYDRLRRWVDGLVDAA